MILILYPFLKIKSEIDILEIDFQSNQIVRKRLKIRFCTIVTQIVEYPGPIDVHRRFVAHKVFYSL
jgi:hypothetical protein